ncbi:ABC transporter substrate-binding protein [Microbacterium sp. GXF0217]
MRYSRTIAAFAAVGIAVGALAGCTASTEPAADDGGDESAELTVTWWGSEARIAMYEEAFEIFEDEHPGVEITGVPSDYKSYWTSRTTEAAARTLPDVMQFDPNLTKYARNGLLLELDEYVGDTLDFSNVNENVVKSAQVDGKQYGVPMGTSTLAVYVNTALVEKAGVEMIDDDYTWDELNDWIMEITAAGATNDEGQAIYGGLDHGVSTNVFYQWLYQQGIEPWDAEGQPGFTKDDIVEFLSLESDAMAADAYYPIERATQVAPLDGFAMGEAATAFVYDNYFARYAPEVGAENIEILPVPSGDDGEKDMWFQVSNYGIGANTKSPEQATALAGFLATDPRVAEIFGTDRGINVDSETLAGFVPKEGTGDATVIAYEEEITPYATESAPLTPENFSSYEAEWLRLNAELSYGNITPQEFADQWWTEAGL